MWRPLDLACARGASATAAYRGELGVRFGAAVWRERCVAAESALSALRRHAAERRELLGGINRRRAAEQRKVASRLAKLQRKWRAALEENSAVRRALDELEAPRCTDR